MIAKITVELMETHHVEPTVRHVAPCEKRNTHADVVALPNPWMTPRKWMQKPVDQPHALAVLKRYPDFSRPRDPGKKANQRTLECRSSMDSIAHQGPR